MSESILQQTFHEFDPAKPSNTDFHRMDSYVNGRIASTAVTAGNAILADWSRLIIGMRLALSIRLNDQLYMGTGELAYFAFSRVDYALEHPAAFMRLYDAP